MANKTMKTVTFAGDIYEIVDEAARADIEILKQNEVDATLSMEGMAADAKATGDAISAINTLVGDTSVSAQIESATSSLVKTVNGAVPDSEGNVNVSAQAGKFYSTAVIGTTWEGSGPYTQTVAVSGILETDTPIVDLLASTDLTTAEAELEAWAAIYRIDTADDSITVYAREATTQEITIQLLGVR